MGRPRRPRGGTAALALRAAVPTGTPRDGAAAIVGTRQDLTEVFELHAAG
ncbi:hypothetical protein [Streptomyces sp. NPDC059378]